MLGLLSHCLGASGRGSDLWECLSQADKVLAPPGMALRGQHGGPALLTGGPHRAEEEAIQ